MFSKLLTKIFGTKQEREVRKLEPIVQKVNEWYEIYGKELKDDDFPKKTEEFKKRLADGETLDEVIPEAFGLVKEACRRNIGRSWNVDGRPQEWNMIPYDVQIMGGYVLAKGKIAEMATGEGKTLVALFPLYIHGLSGKGAHIVTVNDYLAKRDRNWMGPVFEFLGLTVGVVTSELRDQQERRNQYKCDITYGVNHEFGFDYLRDNMALDVRDMVQRGFNFCLIDEVDSILIDEARTPLIISGAVEKDSRQQFLDLKPRVFELVKTQTSLVNNLTSEAEKLLNDGKEREAYFKLLQAQKALPKHKKLGKLLNLTGVKTGVQHLENEFIRDKRMKEITKDLYYTLEERSQVVDLGQLGHDFLARTEDEKDLFMLPDLSTEIHELEKSGLPKSEIEEKKEQLHSSYSVKSEKIHTLHQLLRAYCMYEKDVEYVVQDGRVIIVDQSTGRLKYDSRFGDGMHQAIEAKEGVTIGKDTQTVASVTYQNYFRLYTHLAGMTGTAVTEEGEFFEIYGLEVSEIPTNVPIARKDYEDLVFKTKKEKYRAVIEEIKNLRSQGRPVLVGTPDVDVSEVMHKLLNMEKIPHELLNAKNHAREAQIVKNAGQKAAVTIATNMAGRGTDIKLGEGVKEAGGLAIVGVERHSSRRIDRQLRGRAGRQGDPGTSRFYVSLEDNLMRIFGSERIGGIMDRFGHQEGEPIAHSLITKSIERAQKRVEAYYFSSRKHILEYDNVMNKQRTVVYDRRRRALIKGAISDGIDVPYAAEYGVDPNEDLKSDVFDIIEDFISQTVLDYTGNMSSPEMWNMEGLNEVLMKTMLISVDLESIEKPVKTPNDLIDYIVGLAQKEYEHKEERVSEKLMNLLARIAIIRVLDKSWHEHLYEDEEIRTGIGLMAHGQKDPLVVYKKESFESFKNMLLKVNQETLEFIFRANIKVEAKEEEEREKAEREKLAKLKAQHKQASSGFAQKPEKPQPAKADPKIGRNDPCPCGSGKKYKSCHGKIKQKVEQTEEV